MPLITAEKFLNFPSFKGCSATTRFLRMLDEIFDLLNSTSKFGKWSKALSQTNTGYWMDVSQTTSSHILGLKDLQGKRIVDGRRKTGFLGFLLNMKAVKSVFKTHVEPGSLNYLLTSLTYKLSQDHLEIFFGCIRARLGSNNNPTVPQACNIKTKRMLFTQKK